MSLFPVTLVSTVALVIPREVLGRGALEEKEAGVLLVVRARNESSFSEIIGEVLASPVTEGV